MRFLIWILFLQLSFLRAAATGNQWILKETGRYNLHYTLIDKNTAIEIESYLEAGFKSVSAFFKKPFKNKIDVYIFPDRQSLDEQWKINFKDTSFVSQCWMVGSGCAARLDLISPNVWSSEACEHNGNDKKEVKEIIVHELTHVFHSQYGNNNDFEGMDEMGWLVEGVATYLSGQLTEERLTNVKKLMEAGKQPLKLSMIWNGKHKYGLAGSIIQYIDQSYGRKKLTALLFCTKQQATLELLKTNEEALLSEWKKFILKI